MQLQNSLFHHKQGRAKPRTLEKPSLGSSSSTMATQVFLLSLIIFFSLMIISSSATSTIVSKAAQVLSSLGMISMSLTLQFGPKTLIPQSQNLTIFCPSDVIFAMSGQPSLSLLRFHFSPQSLPLSFLSSLPLGSKITTFAPTLDLFVTSYPSDDRISLNGVKIGKETAYNDGSLIVYEIDKFFYPNFKVSEHECVGAFSQFHHTNSFDEASEALRSKGYFAMASFLESQLENPKQNMMLTIFAPSDETVKPLMGNWSFYPSIFLRHIVPCKIPGGDLVNWEEKKVLETYLDGFNIIVTKSGSDVLINSVKVMFQDLFRSERLVVHGLMSEKDASAAVPNGATTEICKFNYKILLATCCMFLYLSFC